MKNRAVVFASSVAGALLVSAGLVAFVSPYSSAEAKNDAMVTGPPVGALLDEMAPGAIVEKQADGSVSVFGRVKAAVHAESVRAHALLEAGPITIKCDGESVTLECRGVADRDVIPALKAGETGLFGRTVYRSITGDATDGGSPVFESGELVCGAMQSGRKLTCTRVDQVQPVIGHGETLFVTYRPWKVSFDAQGVPIIRIGKPTVPLKRAP